MTTFNIALLFVAVSLGILIAAIVYNSKSKETLRQAKDISEKAKSARLIMIAELERVKNSEKAAWRNMPIDAPISYRMTDAGNLCVVEAEFMAIEEGETTYRIIKRFEYGDDKEYALREAEYLLQTLNEK